MSYEEIRAGFLGYYEKRLKLQLLIGELQTIRESATNLVIPEDKRSTSYSIQDFQLQVVESVLADTYTILVEDPELLQLLALIRGACKATNNKLHIFYSQVVLPLTNLDQLVSAHNESLVESAPRLAQACEQAVQRLKRLSGS